MRQITGVTSSLPWTTYLVRHSFTWHGETSRAIDSNIIAHYGVSPYQELHVAELKAPAFLAFCNVIWTAISTARSASVSGFFAWRS